MTEFIAANFNLPTIIVAALVFGALAGSYGTPTSTAAAAAAAAIAATARAATEH